MNCKYMPNVVPVFPWGFLLLTFVAATSCRNARSLDKSDSDTGTETVGDEDSYHNDGAEIEMDSDSTTDTIFVTDTVEDTGSTVEADTDFERGDRDSADTDHSTSSDMDTAAASSDSETGPTPDTATQTDMGTPTDNVTDTGVAAGADTDTGTGADTDSARDLPTDCTGLADMTLCSVVTVPDRGFDICIHEACVSPGCGTASCNVPGPYFLLPDSGQRTCFDNSGALERCPAQGEDFYGQDARYGRDVNDDAGMRYTRISDLTDEPIVEDNVTGLIWQGCIAGLRGDDCSDGTVTTLNWEDALEYCDGLDWGGFSDWRLPDEYALFSIVNFGVDRLDLGENAFSEAQGHEYWSSSSYADMEDSAYNVFAGQIFRSSRNKGRTESVRCVRGGLSTLRHFTSTVAANDRVVTDRMNNLQWQGCTAGQSGPDCTVGEATGMTWQEALNYCETLSLGEHDDWRLPNIVTLQSIVENSVYAPSIDPDAFPKTKTDRYWSSTSNFADGDSAWEVGFEVGSVMRSSKHKIGEYEIFAYVRCVRNVI